MYQQVKPIKVKTHFIAKITGIVGVVIGVIVVGIFYLTIGNYFGTQIMIAIPIGAGIFFYVIGFLMGLFMNWMSKRVMKFSEKMQEHIYEDDTSAYFKKK